MYKNNYHPTVAVLLAAYNGMSWIEEQIDSILAQDNIKVDLYLSVDVSNDGTYGWCQALVKKNNRVVVLPYGERFGGAAKNFFRLIREVNFESYDFVALADQDDVWLSNKLGHAVETIQQKDLQAFSSSVTAFFQDGREQLIKKSYPQKRFDYFFESGAPGCTYVFRSQSLMQFKQFLILNWEAVNNITFHDWVLYAYFRFHGLAWHIDSKPLMRYRRHESNQIGPNAGIEAYKKRLMMVKEGWYRQEVGLIFALIDAYGDSKMRLNRLFLIRHFWQLRRRPREALVLLIMLILGIF